MKLRILFRTPEGKPVVLNGPSEHAIVEAKPRIEAHLGTTLEYEETNGIYCPSGEDWVLVGTHEAASFDDYLNFSVEC